MLRCRGQPVALRYLAGVLEPTLRRGWRQAGPSATLVAPRDAVRYYMSAGDKTRARRRRNSAAAAAAAVTKGNIPDGSSRTVHGTVRGTTTSAEKAAGPKAAELRAWQLAMLELAHRHGMPQVTENHSKDPNKISKRTADYIPEVLEAWRKVVDDNSGRGLWFRGAAKFYASSLGGVWPKIANSFLEHLVRMCDDSTGDGAGPEPSPSPDGLRRRGSGSTKKSISPKAAAATAAEAEGGGQLDWKRGTEILKEAHNAGVVVQPDLMVIALSKAPLGNSRKISFLVSDKGSRAFGFLASPDMLATAAIAHWREGVVTGAVRHLGKMFTRSSESKKRRLASPGPLVHEWLAAVTQGGGPAAENEGASSLASPAPSRQRQWPWLLVVVDIYGRAGRWAEAAEAFGAFAGKSFLDDLCSPGGGFVTRLPMPDEIGGGGGGGGGVPARGELSAIPLEAWASFHPSALVHATTSYLKLGMAEEAAEVLSFLRAAATLEVSAHSSSSAAAAAGGISGTREAGGGGGGGGRRGTVEGGDQGRRGATTAVASHFTSAGPSDPAWIEGTVRGFARLGGWDLASGVLSPEIVGWFSSGAGSGAAGNDGRLALVFESLEAFLESKLAAKRPAPGQANGSRTCLGLLKACRARGLLERDEEALVCAEALRWLPPPRAAAAAPAGGDAAESSEPGEQDGTGPAARGHFGGDYPAVLRSRCEELSEEAVLRTIGRAWVTDDEHQEGVSDATKERRRFAAFALFEAGVAANALAADGHWTSQSAGVLSLNYREYQMQDGAPLAALNLVLSDMRRKYAYEESVERYVHQPQADLVMIVSVRDHTRALDTARDILWLLGVSSRYGAPLGGLELLGRGETGHLVHPAAAAAATRQQGDGEDEAARTQEETLLRVVQHQQQKQQQQQQQQQRQQKASKQGIVLSLPRRALQGWLLREGRARRASRGVVDDGGLWTPSWVEDGIDVVPPTLPGFGVVGGYGVDSVSGGGGSRGASLESTVASWSPAREAL